MHLKFKAPFGQVDFRENRKKNEEKRGREKFIGVFGWVDLWKKNQRDSSIFSPDPPKCFLPKFERKLKKKYYASQRPNLPLPFHYVCALSYVHVVCFFFFFSDFPSSFSIFLLFYHFNQKERHVLLNFFSFFFLEIKDGTFY